MPPGLQLLLPAAVLALGALVAWLAGSGGLDAGRLVAASSAWAALVALVVLWAPQRVPIELHGLALGGGLTFGQRLDALGFVHALAVLVPACLLLTFQRRDWQGAGAAALTVAFSLTAVLGDSLAVTALALGAAGTVALVQVRSESEVGIRSFWPCQLAGWIALLWAAAALQATTGTSAYAAVPVAAAQGPLFALLAAGALLVSGALPWRGWLSEFWDRPRLVTGSLAVAALFPVGFLVLFRSYEMGGGHWPQPALNVAVALAGGAVAVGAAVRAQSAATRRSALAESLPGLAGFALVGLAIGSPLGITAALSCVLAVAVTAALLPLLPDGRWATFLAGSALASGLPPGLAFAARLLTVEAGIEAGSPAAFLAVLLALAWLLELAASARASRLPAAAAGAVAAGSLPGALLGLALGLAGGAGFGLLATAVSVPAASGLVQFTVNSLTGTPLAAASASGAWPAVALGVPLAALALLLLPLLGWEVPRHREPAPEPFFAVGWALRARRGYERLVALRLPEQYASLFNPGALEVAMARGQPVLWVVLLLVLAVAVNR